MKPLRPASREKKRYLLVIGEDLKKNIEKAILEFIGVFGMSKTGLEFIKEGKDYAIISINREMLAPVRACFAVSSKSINVKKVSGTLLSLKK
jgi:RNase P/RNase MRP subunit POP5